MAAGHRFVQCLAWCAAASGDYDWADLMTAETPDTTLHSRIIAPRFGGNGDDADETEESG